MKHQKIIKDIVIGNGNSYTIKEILSAHISDFKSFKVDVLKNMKDGAVLMAENRSKIKGIRKMLFYGASSILLFVLGWLVKLQFNVGKLIGKVYP